MKLSRYKSKLFTFRCLTLFLFCGFFQSGCEWTSKKPSASPAVEGKISGTITVTSELQPTLKETDVLFIIARTEQVGPPSAVKRIVNPKFPLTYQIGAEDAMIAGSGGFEKNSNLTLAARISRSGNAMPASGDVEGVYPKNPAHPGDSGIDIVIDRIRP